MTKGYRGGNAFPGSRGTAVRVPDGRFRDREEAGRRLASLLLGTVGDPDTIVLALPRGGVPVAFEVAVSLGLPLDVFIVRKLGVPGHEELAMGALASGGVRVLNEDLVRQLEIPGAVVDDVTEREKVILGERERLYRGPRQFPAIKGRTVILIDDGVATGATMKAAIRALRTEGPRRIVVAVPVSPPSTVRELRALADDVVCIQTPEPFEAVGLWYQEFPQTSDQEVAELLKRAAASLHATG